MISGHIINLIKTKLINGNSVIFFNFNQIININLAQAHFGVQNWKIFNVVQ